MNRIRQFELEGGVSRSKVSAFDGQEDTDSDWQSIPMRNLENMWSYNVLAGLDTTEAQHIQHRCCDLISANSISPTKAERKVSFECIHGHNSTSSLSASDDMADKKKHSLDLLMQEVGLLSSSGLLCRGSGELSSSSSSSGKQQEVTPPGTPHSGRIGNPRTGTRKPPGEIDFSSLLRQETDDQRAAKHVGRSRAHYNSRFEDRGGAVGAGLHRVSDSGSIESVPEVTTRAPVSRVNSAMEPFEPNPGPFRRSLSMSGTALELLIAGLGWKDGCDNGAVPPNEAQNSEERRGHVRAHRHTIAGSFELMDLRAERASPPRLPLSPSKRGSESSLARLACGEGSGANGTRQQGSLYSTPVGSTSWQGEATAASFPSQRGSHDAPSPAAGVGPGEKETRKEGASRDGDGERSSGVDRPARPVSLSDIMFRSRTEGVASRARTWNDSEGSVEEPPRRPAHAGARGRARASPQASRRRQDAPACRVVGFDQGASPKTHSADCVTPKGQERAEECRDAAPRPCKSRMEAAAVEESTDTSRHVQRQRRQSAETAEMDHWNMELDTGRELFYHLNHARQTYEFVQRMHHKHSKSTAKAIDIWTAIGHLGELEDYEASMKGFTTTTHYSILEHAILTAENIRMAFPNEVWFQVVGLIHGLGHLLGHKLFDCQPQWAVCGETFPVGCKFDSQIQWSQFFAANPDKRKRKYSTPHGIYGQNCGLSKVMMSWSGYEFLYAALVRNKTSLPAEALFCIRYLAFDTLGVNGAYGHLTNNRDRYMMPWLLRLRHFRQMAYDQLHRDVPSMDHVKSVYGPLLKQYLPEDFKL